MLYDKYEERIKKLSRLRDWLIRRRFVIMIVMVILVAITSTLLAIKGTIYQDTTITDTITYGQGLDFRAKALFGKVNYEYAAEGAQDWSNIEPKQIGNYKVRAVAKRIFGSPVYSEAQSYTIKPKEIDLHFAEDTAEYGEIPLVGGATEFGDVIAVSAFEYIELSIVQASVVILQENIRIYDVQGNDVTNSYVFGPIEGQLALQKRLITLDSGSKTKVYDGQPLSFDPLNDDLSVAGMRQLLEGHKLEIVEGVSITNAGSKANELTLRVIDGQGEDVSEYYDFRYTESSMLTVTPKPVNIDTLGGDKVFDGEELTAGYNVTGLIQGHKVDVNTVKTAALVRAGEMNNTISNVAIITDAGENVTDNYDIIYTYGTLSVAQRTVAIDTPDDVFVYDGVPKHSIAGINAYGLIDGHTVSAVKNKYASITNVGIVDNELFALITDSKGIDYTDCYNVNYSYGKLEVTKRPISIKTRDNAVLYYNGQEQNYGEHVAGELVNGHKTVITEYKDSIKDIGTKNSPDWIRVKVVDSQGEDVSINYDIQYLGGLVTMEPKPIFVNTGTQTFVYDGNPHSYPEYTLSDIIGGHTSKVVEGSPAIITNVGTQFNELVISIFDQTGQDTTHNYTLSYSYGVLKVTPRPITILTASNTWEYDGETHKDFGYTIAKGNVVEGHSVIVNNGLVIRDVFRSSDFNYGEVIGRENQLIVDIVDGSNQNTVLSNNYDINYDYGVLMISPRVIKITTESKSWLYDGYTHYHLGFEWEGDLLSGHVIEAIPYQSSYIQNVIWEEDGTVGCIINDLLMVVRNELDGLSYTHNYEYEYIDYGELTLIPREITVRTYDGEWVYNASPRSAPRVTLVPERVHGLADGEVLDGDVYSATQVTNVILLEDGSIGSKPNIVKAIVQNAKGENTITNYVITYEYGQLTITPRPITIALTNESKQYDKTPLTSNVAYVYNIVNIHWVEILTDGSQLDIGTSDNTITHYKIWDGYEDLTYNYTVETRAGTLTVTKRYIYIEPVNIDKRYDGQPLIAEKYNINYSDILNGHMIAKVEVEGQRTDVGISQIHVKEGYQIIDQLTGEDVGDYYSINTYTGIIHIWGREIIVKTGSAQKEYDGTPLQCAEYELSGEGLLPGHEFWIGQFAQITEVGRIRNYLYDVTIRNQNGEYFNDYYKIVADWGFLTVTGDAGGGNLNLDGTIDRDSNGGNGGSGGNHVVFRATSATSGKVYFRIKSFGDYTTNGWKDASPYLRSGVNPLAFMNSAVPFRTGVSHIDIVPISNTLSYMVPYYSDNNAYNGVLDDTQINYQYYSSYGMSYRPYTYNSTDLLIVRDTFKQYEQDYYQYVRSMYLNLPENTRLKLLDIAASKGLDATSNDILHQVAKLVQTTVKYDRNFGSYKGDIALYFFNGAKKGICQHYATAATAMFRALGIPARYTIGFVGEMTSGVTVDVTAEQAHAWVEVYIQGAGWVMLEVTGAGEGSGSGGNWDTGGTGGTGEGAYSPIKLSIKPVDIFKYAYGTVLFQEDLNKIEAINIDSIYTLEKLLNQGYKYNANILYGDNESLITGFVLYDSYGRNVTGDFAISDSKGRVIRIAKPIVINVFTRQKYYDGQKLKYKTNDYWIDPEYLTEGLNLKLELKGELTNAGILPLSNLERLPYTIYNGYENVTNEYTLIFVGKPLRVDRCPIEITSSPASKVYDGQPLTADSAWISKGKLADGHTYTVGVSGSIVDIGSIRNTITMINIRDGLGENVISNYLITTVEGWLVVKEP